MVWGVGKEGTSTHAIGCCPCRGSKGASSKKLTLRGELLAVLSAASSSSRESVWGMFQEVASNCNCEGCTVPLLGSESSMWTVTGPETACILTTLTRAVLVE